ncbi:MAG: copper resistance D family protein, partial [Candidatus Limnocylindria bacterium]
LALLMVAQRLTGIVAAATGLIGIVLLVAAGHAAALPGFAPLIGQVVHVLGAAVWFGGIAGLLVLVVRPRLVTEDRDRIRLREAVPRFSALALVSIGILGLTGVYAAWMQTGVLVTLDTEYGRTLLMKSGLAVGALALGGLNFLDGGRMLRWLDGFRARLTVETMAATGVLLITAVLATTTPLEEARGAPIEPIPDAFGEVAPGMEMEVIPARPGVNRITVTATDALAASSLELGLDRLDDGSTTRVPLVMEGMEGMQAMDHGGMAGMTEGTDDGTARWIADALVLPAGSQWDTSVRIMSVDGETELSRQRFAFVMEAGGIGEGRVRSLLNPATGIAVLLVLGGALGLGLGLGGARLPRCEALASRLALVAGGLIGVALGGLIGVSRLIA